MTNTEIIERLYADFKARNLDRIRSVFDDQIEWTQMAGFPRGGHHVGPDAVFEKVFKGFSDNWTGWGAVVEEYTAQDDTVWAIGYYTGTFNATGRSMRSEFAHRYVLRDGKVIRFVQYADTFMVAEAMGLTVPPDQSE